MRALIPLLLVILAAMPSAGQSQTVPELRVAIIDGNVVSYDPGRDALPLEMNFTGCNQLNDSGVRVRNFDVLNCRAQDIFGEKDKDGNITSKVVAMHFPAMAGLTSSAVASFLPDLVIMHLSSFKGLGMEIQKVDSLAPCALVNPDSLKSDENCVPRAIEFLANVFKKTKVKPLIIIYSRSSGLCESSIQYEVSREAGNNFIGDKQLAQDFRNSIGFFALTESVGRPTFRSPTVDEPLSNLFLKLHGTDVSIELGAKAGICILKEKK